MFALVTATPPETHVENWDAAYHDGHCIVQRNGSVSADEVEVTSISWDIVFNYFKVTISAPVSGVGWKTMGEPTYEVASEPMRVPKPSFTSRKLSGKRYDVEVRLSRDWAKSVSFSGLGLKTADGRRVVSPDGLTDGQNLLNACRSQYLQQLDIDPAEVGYSFTRAIPSPNPKIWFDEADLPRSRSDRALYRPFVIWRVDTNGQPSRCKLVSSSGKVELDVAICSSFMKRVRYSKPAIDANGNPIASWDGRRIAIIY
jgi:hypothetical protein